MTLELAKKSTSPALPRILIIRVAGGGICNLCDDDPVERQMKRLLVKVHPLIHQSFILRCLPLFIVQDISSVSECDMWVIVGWCSDAELCQKLWVAKVTSKKLVKNAKVWQVSYKVKYNRRHVSQRRYGIWLELYVTYSSGAHPPISRVSFEWGCPHS